MNRFQHLVFIGLCNLLLWNIPHAQQLPLKYATLELFTNTPCPICASQNPGLFSRLEAYDGLYHLISFYPGKPYASCVFYQANISENTARLNFYSQVFGTPTVAINGLQFSNSNGVSNTVLNNVTNGESWLEIAVDETSGSDRTVNITLEDHVGGSLTSGKLFAAIVEREIMYNAPNGETVHYNVFRRFLSNVNGDDVDLGSGMVNISYDYSIDAAWQADEVYVIAWLMDPDSKEIYNSGTRFDPDFTSSTDDETTDLKFRIYPNPASSEVRIVLPENVRGVPIKIYNATGQLIHEAHDSHISFNISEWPVGSYYVEIIEGSRTWGGSLHVVR